jgi:hypothetical protein
VRHIRALQSQARRRVLTGRCRPARRRWEAVTAAAAAQGLLARLETPALLALLQALFAQQAAVGAGFKEAAGEELGRRGGGAAAQQARDCLRGLP